MTYPDPDRAYGGSERRGNGFTLLELILVRIVLPFMVGCLVGLLIARIVA